MGGVGGVGGVRGGDATVQQIPKEIGQSKVARVASRNARFREKSEDFRQILLQDKLYFSF